MRKKIRPKGLTFADVLLLPAYSEVTPRDVETRTRLTKKISLNIPLVGAAMDTVSEFTFAITLACQGGIAIIHKNMSIDQQVEHVKKVKRAENGLIHEPFTLLPTATVGDAKKMMSEKHIGGIPIVDENNKLLGIVTNSNLKFEDDDSKLLKKIMKHGTELITAPVGTTISEAKEILTKNKIEKLPIVDSKNTLCGLYTYKDIEALKMRPLASKDENGQLLCGAAIGITSDIMDRVTALYKAGVDVVVLDSAHGHSKNIIDALTLIKKSLPGLQVIAGNVCTYEGARALIEAGADAIKVGVGPGSICTTRIVSGVGSPQLTAIMEAYRACKTKNIPLIADGGIQSSGDITKAIAAGADTVMIGSLFAGTDETPGETMIFEGRKFKKYRGMGSVEAMEDGSKDRYFQDSETDTRKLVPEGVVGRVPYKGMLWEVVHQLIGGLRSGMGYCGAKNISELQENSEFIEITASGVKESHPHNIEITNSAPNYSL